MDPLHTAIALFPLGLYLLWLAAIYWRRRPIVLSGTADVSLLAAAVSGFVVVGPLELLMPVNLPLPGPAVWGMMLACYILSVTLWNLLARPRLVILNITAQQLRPLLAEIAARLDSHPQWAGDSLALEELGIQLHLDDFPPMRTVSLVALGNKQSESGWRKLQTELTVALRPVAAPSVGSYLLLIAGLAMIGWPLWSVMTMDRVAFVEKLTDLLRL